MKVKKQRLSDYSPTKSNWAILNVLWTDEPLPTASQEVRVLCLTWNMKGKPTPEILSDVLLTSSKHHIYIISTQECLRPIALSLVYSQMHDWEEKVTSVLGSDYVLLAGDSLGGTHLMLISHTSLASRFSEIQINSAATGFFNVVPNKGGVGISFTFNLKKFLVVGCHLAAGENNVLERNEGLGRILDTFEKNKHFDVVIVSGDLNYRMIGSWNEVNQLVRYRERAVLLKRDEMLGEMRGGRIAFGFKEGEIEFQPTYKLENGHYVTNRVPSWTDRIIFRDRFELMSQVSYSSIPNIYSDHFPVFSQFTMNL